jgi:hypothetical protein
MKNKQQKQTIIKIAQTKINIKIKNQHNKFQSQQSNQQALPTRRESPNTPKINDEKYNHIGIK